MKRMIITPEQLESAADRYLSGETIRAIAANIGVPEPTLRAAVKRLGVSRPHLGHGPKRKLSSEQEQNIAKQYSSGKAAHAISVETGIPVTSVRRTLSRLGINKNPDFEKSDPLTEEEKDFVIDECLYGSTMGTLAKLLDVSTQTIGRTLSERGVSLGSGRRPRLCTVDESVFDTITPVSARWMGFLFADGCLPRDKNGQQSISMNIGAKDHEHVKKFRAFLKSNHAIVNIRNKERLIGNSKKPSPAAPAVYYKVRSNRLSKVLIAHGMRVGKSPDRTPSDELAQLPAFWAGMIDGDGWLGVGANGFYHYPYIGLCGHIPMLEKFKSFIRRITLLDITPTESGIYRIQTSGETAKNIIRLLYNEESAQAGLNRKVVRAREIINGGPITPYEEGRVLSVIEE